MMNDKDFAKEVTRIINLVAAAVEENDIYGNIDVDINGDILSITSSAGVFVINKQSSVKEIWLSSPVSGPYHFLHDGTAWKSKAGDEFFRVLSNDLKVEIKDLV
jgi:CyaY protein